MKKSFYGILILMVCFYLSGCDSNMTSNNIQKSLPSKVQSDTEITESDKQSSEVLRTMDLTITVGKESFNAKLYENNTTQDLIDILPITMNMSELNGNEKYYYISSTLATSSERPEEIHAGDIMLYGNNCIVIFYDTFSSPYQYTRLGYIEDATDFAQVIGNKPCEVTLDIAKNEKYGE